MVDIRRKPGLVFGLVTLGIFGTIMFFSKVNLTQPQAVMSLFALLGVVGGIWFWWKPWK